MVQFMFSKGGIFWWKTTSLQSLDLIQKAQKPIFALVISHSGCENKLMFIYVILKSLISRAQLVKLGVKSQFLNYNSKVHSGGSLLMHVSIGFLQRR